MYWLDIVAAAVVSWVVYSMLMLYTAVPSAVESPKRRNHPLLFPAEIHMPVACTYEVC